MDRERERERERKGKRERMCFSSIFSWENLYNYTAMNITDNFFKNYKNKKEPIFASASLDVTRKYFFHSNFLISDNISHSPPASGSKIRINKVLMLFSLCITDSFIEFWEIWL